MPGKTNTNNNTKKKSSTNTRIQKKPIFAALRGVFQQICKRDSLDVKMTKDIEQVMKWGKFSKEEALLFSFFATQSVNSSGTEWWQFDDLQNYLDVETCDYAEYIPVMDKLLQKGCFCLRYNMTYAPGTFNKDTYFALPEELEKRLCYNEKFVPFIPKDNTNTENNCLAYLYRASKEGYVSASDYYRELIDSIYKNDETLRIFKETETWYDHLTPTEALQLFTRIGGLLIANNESVSLKSALEDIREGDPGFIIREMKDFKEENCILLKKDIFKVDKSNFGDDIKITWGDYAHEHIFQGDAEMLVQATKVKELGVIKCEDIKEKTLFYNESNQQDIDRLRGLLDDKNYLEMRKRLEDKNMPKGLIILMYGPPGTGKTETVMQLARETGRNLFHVNVQEVRSCWVGESEKNTKKIFESYSKDKSNKKPILLFNEADAIISKRTSIGSNASVDKMENAMQNIILEEFENFDGICVMTSNMPENFDPAFDRRILFKLKLENPKLETKMKIWRNKIEDLSEADARRISEQFDLSGGQIENIRRKITLDEILYGNKPNIDTILDFCKKEKFENEDSRPLGFQL